MNKEIPSPKIIRQRFPDEIITALLEIAWWNWSIEEISCRLEEIVAADIEALSKV